MLSCQERVKRTNKFKADPLLPKETSLDADYKRSGYDRGHNMDAYDNGCDVQGMNESFYYSNMCPQTPRLNRGQWKALEEYTRHKAMQYDSVLVWCGSVSISDEYIGRVSVPDYCWKIIFIKKTGIIEAYSFLNDKELSVPFETCKVSLDSVYHLSGFIFKKRG
jgi:endonuclease G